MPWPKGKPQSPESVEKRRIAFADPAVKAKMSEAKRGKSLTPEHCAKISQGLTGHTVSEKALAVLKKTWVTKDRSDEFRQKMSNAIKIKWQNAEYRTRCLESRKGKQPRAGSKATDESKEKMRISHTGKSRTTESCFKQGISITGSKHHAWKGGPLASNHRGVGWGTIKKLVRLRAGGKCEACGGVNVRGWQLDVHHKVRYRINPVSTVDGCVGLCRSCHIKAESGKIDF